MNETINTQIKIDASAACLAQGLRHHRPGVDYPASPAAVDSLSTFGENRMVYMFGEGSSSSRKAEVRGGKGSGLAELVALGMPVPPGATITTEVAQSFAASGALPASVALELSRAVQIIEGESGLVLGSADRPLLLSVRSGARVSMPGMIDTVLKSPPSPS